MNKVTIIFGIVALVLATMSSRDYFNNNRKLSASGKIWIKMALIFTAIGVYVNWGP